MVMTLAWSVTSVGSNNLLNVRMPCDNIQRFIYHFEFTWYLGSLRGVHCAALKGLIAFLLCIAPTIDLTAGCCAALKGHALPLSASSRADDPRRG